MKIKLLLFVSLFSTLAFSQRLPITAPNYPLINEEIHDIHSKYYYPTLFQRFMANDTTLNVEEYRYLYYGYTFQKEYRPYWHSQQDSILKKYSETEQLDISDCDSIIRYATLSLSAFPFDLHKFDLLSYAYRRKGNIGLSKLYMRKNEQILEAIMSSGNGRSVLTAWHVISVDHEYEILYLLGLFAENQTLVGDNCDYIFVSKNRYNVKGLFFDVKRLFELQPQRIGAK
jgi:hypothetical protein